MTHRDLDDEKLILFLRANRPIVPDAPPNLEERVLRATVLRPRPFSRILGQLRSLRLAIAIPVTLGACAAVVALFFVGRPQFMEMQVVGTSTPMSIIMTNAEVGDIAEFMETAWQVSVSSDDNHYLIDDLSF